MLLKQCASEEARLIPKSTVVIKVPNTGVCEIGPTEQRKLTGVEKCKSIRPGGGKRHSH